MAATLAVVPATKANLGNWQLALVYFVAALPFVVGGIIVSMVISETMERVNRIYFFDLLGAAVGCLLLVPLLNLLGGAGTVLSAALLFVAGGAVWHSMASSRIPTMVSAALAAASIAFLILNTNGNFVGVKLGQNEIFVKWNSFSRIAMNKAHETSAPSIVIDGDASTDIFSVDFEHLPLRDRQYMLNNATALPYLLRPHAKVRIIGPGGGLDVIHAVLSGSKDVTGVEINPIIATTIMRERYPDLSLGLFAARSAHCGGRRPQLCPAQCREIRSHPGHPCGYLGRHRCGRLRPLGKQSLYFRSVSRYLTHLTGDGILTFSRWGFATPRESLRIVSLAIDALRKMGKTRPSEHVIAIRLGDASKGLALDTLLISANPFTPADLALSENAMGKMDGVTALYFPNEQIPNPFTGLLQSKDPREFERAYPFDISPVDDNRPFFFYSVQPADWRRFLTSGPQSSMDDKVNRAVPLLFELAGVSLMATMIILALPPLILGKRLLLHQGVLTFLLYFVFIGVGYILVEVALIQKFVLFLGHPTYALTVVIFSVLVSSGLGSYFSPHILQAGISAWMKLLAMVASLTVVLGVATSFLLTPAVGLPLWLKIAIAVLMIAPAGFVMGMPFPIGLKRLQEMHLPSVRWAWSLNAAASVMGSVGALVSAIYLGLLQTLTLGGALYLAALIVVAVKKKDFAALACPMKAG